MAFARANRGVRAVDGFRHRQPLRAPPGFLRPAGCALLSGRRRSLVAVLHHAGPVAVGTLLVLWFGPRRTAPAADFAGALAYPGRPAAAPGVGAGRLVRCAALSRRLFGGVW